MGFSRREFGKLAASLPMAQLLGTTFATAAEAAANDSTFGGVKVGIIAPYAFRGTARDVDQILKGITDLGLSHVEMQAEPVEAFAGAPARRRGPRGPRGAGRPGRGVPADGRQLVKAAHHLAKIRLEDVAKAAAQVARHLDEEVAVAAR